MSHFANMPVEWADGARLLVAEKKLSPAEAELFAAFMSFLWMLERRGCYDTRTWEAAADYIVEGRLRFAITPAGRAALAADPSADVDELEAGYGSGPAPCMYCHDTGFYIAGGTSIRVGAECNYCTSAERRERARARGQG